MRKRLKKLIGENVDVFPYIITGTSQLTRVSPVLLVRQEKNVAQIKKVVKMGKNVSLAKSASKKIDKNKP